MSDPFSSSDPFAPPAPAKPRRRRARRIVSYTMVLVLVIAGSWFSGSRPDVVRDWVPGFLADRMGICSDDRRVVTADEVTLRVQPEDEAKPVAVLHRGDIVIASAETRAGGWVLYRNASGSRQEGWASEEAFGCIPEATPTPATSASPKR